MGRESPVAIRIVRLGSERAENEGLRELLAEKGGKVV